MQTPLVSVILPVYNCEKFIGEAIESILAQSHKNFELLILNDASTDGSVTIARSYSDSRIKVFDFDEKQGLISLLNVGIEHAQGSFIMRMDADDISADKRIEKQVRYLEEHPDIDLCSSWVQYFNENGPLGVSKGYSEDIYLKLELLYRPGFAHPSVMIRKKVFDEGIRYRIPQADDYDLWIQLSDKSKFYKIPEVLLKYRMHTQQVSNTNKGEIKSACLAVQSQFLKANCVDLSFNYLKIHHDLTSYNYSFSKYYLLRVVSYFRIVRRQLLRSGKYDTRVIERYLDDQFYAICSHFIKNGVNSFNLYFSQRMMQVPSRVGFLFLKSVFLKSRNNRPW